MIRRLLRTAAAGAVGSIACCIAVAVIAEARDRRSREGTVTLHIVPDPSRFKIAATQAAVRAADHDANQRQGYA